MTQIDTLLTARAQPLSRLLLKLDINGQSDGGAEFAQVWSVQAHDLVEKDATRVLIQDVLPDTDTANAINVASPDAVVENEEPHSISSTEMSSAFNDKARFVQRGASSTLSDIEPPIARNVGVTITEGQNFPMVAIASANDSRSVSLHFNKMGALRQTAKPENDAPPVIAPQLNGLKRPPISKKTPTTAQELAESPKSVRQTLWNATASPSRDPIVSAMPPAVPIAPILTKLEPPAPVIIGDENLDAEFGAPAVSQSTATMTTAATAALQRSYAPQVAQQIASAIIQTSGATTEIALNPEELGRVRISLTVGDTGLTVAIIAERPETVDLMRRNIDHLTRELREMGYENPAFTFGDQSGDADQNQGGGAKQSGTASNHSAVDDHPLTSMRVALSGGLDLKL